MCYVYDICTLVAGGVLTCWFMESTCGFLDVSQGGSNWLLAQGGESCLQSFCLP